MEFKTFMRSLLCFTKPYGFLAIHITKEETFQTPYVYILGSRIHLPMAFNLSHTCFLVIARSRSLTKRINLNLLSFLGYFSTTFGSYGSTKRYLLKMISPFLICGRVVKNIFLQKCLASLWFNAALVLYLSIKICLNSQNMMLLQ